MSRRSVILGLLVFLAVAAHAAPKLAVLVVVDQMRADYLERSGARFSRGFKTLLKNSLIYTKARVGSVPSDTAPGHATMATGVFPREHGIVGNRWWIRASRLDVKVVKDGVGRAPASLLLKPTVADLLKEKFPRSRIASLSLKARAAVFLAGKGADWVFWFDEKSGRFTSFSKANLPPWLGDFNKGNNPFLHAIGVVPEPVRRRFLVSPQSDRLLLALVEELVRRTDLGADETPDLLMISFSGTDYTGHQFGPDSEEMNRQMESLDAVLGELLDVLEKRSGPDGLAFLLTSDHGVMEVPESDTGRAHKALRVRSDRFNAEVERRLQREFPVPGNRWVVRYYPPHLYLNRDLVGRMGLNWNAFLLRASIALEELPEVARVYIPGRDELGDPYQEYYERGTCPGRSGDLLLRIHSHVLIKPYYVKTGHGGPYDYDQRIPLMVMGKGIQPGRSEEEVNLTEVAALLKALLFGDDQ